MSFQLQANILVIYCILFEVIDFVLVLPSIFAIQELLIFSYNGKNECKESFLEIKEVYCSKYLCIPVKVIFLVVEDKKKKKTNKPKIWENERKKFSSCDFF